ncbi:MAG: YegS/Rv2252/BmrU family lipid kinase [Actinobacteria bacterium]|nr:YegS/Rv2252/BmrU family lipid kinase [Actinomycetota bacterium]
MSSTKVLILVNPKSGRGKALDIALGLLKFAQKNAITAVLLEPIDAKAAITDLRVALSRTTYRAVISIGGDGLVHLASQVLSGSGVPLFIVPAGTGNDVARSNSLLTTNPSEIFEAIRTWKPKLIDVGKIVLNQENRNFVQILSTGFDAQVNERANRNRFVTGKMKYNFATLAVLPAFRPIEYELEVDGIQRRFKAMLVAVANGASYGGGMQLCPMADRSDGFLDIMILHPVSKLELLKVFPRVYSGKHVTHPAVEFVRAKTIKLDADTVAYADGELIGRLPISVSVEPQNLATWMAS